MRHKFEAQKIQGLNFSCINSTKKIESDQVIGHKIFAQYCKTEVLMRSL